ncbi:MAG: hypothetical protein QM632_02865 [Micrococcaceae bacterium]
MLENNNKNYNANSERGAFEKELESLVSAFPRTFVWLVGIPIALFIWSEMKLKGKAIGFAAHKALVIQLFWQIFPFLVILLVAYILLRIFFPNNWFTLFLREITPFGDFGANGFRVTGDIQKLLELFDEDSHVRKQPKSVDDAKIFTNERKTKVVLNLIISELAKVDGVIVPVKKVGKRHQADLFGYRLVFPAEFWSGSEADLNAWADKGKHYLAAYDFKVRRTNKDWIIDFMVQGDVQNKNVSLEDLD